MGCAIAWLKHRAICLKNPGWASPKGLPDNVPIAMAEALCWTAVMAAPASKKTLLPGRYTAASVLRAAGVFRPVRLQWCRPYSARTGTVIVVKASKRS